MLWEDLTSDEFAKACIEAEGVCIIPFGVIEKHGSHLPLGTDMIVAREIAIRASEREPAVVFPYYYFGQINEARHVPGTIAISPELMYRVLDEICREISRNGLKKILILNGHGGNPSFIKYFLQCTLYEKKDYAVYGIEPRLSEDEAREIKAILGSEDMGAHAGNSETSRVMAIRPDLVKMDQVDHEGLVVHDRLKFLEDIFTGIYWYAAHPRHFAGEPFHASAEAGRKHLEFVIARVARAIRIIKDDQVTRKLQDEFFAQC